MVQVRKILSRGFLESVVSEADVLLADIGYDSEFFTQSGQRFEHSENMENAARELYRKVNAFLEKLHEAHIIDLNRLRSHGSWTEPDAEPWYCDIYSENRVQMSCKNFHTDDPKELFRSIVRHGKYNAELILAGKSDQIKAPWSLDWRPGILEASAE